MFLLATAAAAQRRDQWVCCPYGYLLLQILYGAHTGVGIDMGATKISYVLQHFF